MAKLKIYGVAASRAFRNLWTVFELGLDYEQVELSFDEKGVKGPDFLRINPNGKVPAIGDGDFTLWESMAINLYVAKKHGRGLYPQDLQGEAKCWQWSFWAVNEIEQQLFAWAFNTMLAPPEKRDAAKAAEALAQLQGPLGVLDKHLADHAYLLGAAFTIADINLATTMFRALKMDLSARPHVKAWLDRCYARPAAEKAVKMRG